MDGLKPKLSKLQGPTQEPLEPVRRKSDLLEVLVDKHVIGLLRNNATDEDHQAAEHLEPATLTDHSTGSDISRIRWENSLVEQDLLQKKQEAASSNNGATNRVESTLSFHPAKRDASSIRHDSADNYDVITAPSLATASDVNIDDSHEIPGAYRVAGIDAPADSEMFEEEGSVTESSDRGLLPEEEPINSGDDPALSSYLVLQEKEDSGDSDDEDVDVFHPEDLEEALDVHRISESTADRKQQDSDRPNSKFGWAVMLLVFGAVLALILWLLLQNDSKSNADGTFTANNATVSFDKKNASEVVTEASTAFFRYPIFNETGMEHAVKAAIREDPDSSYYKANEWMIKDPFLDTYPFWKQHQRFTHAMRWYALNGENWFRNDDWMRYDVDECEWWSAHPKHGQKYGICDEEGHILVVNLTSNNLDGEGPKGASLPRAKIMDYSNNQLRGTFPSCISKAPLEAIDLSNNSIGGAITAEAGVSSPWLRTCRVDSNQLGGDLKFPPELFPRIELFNLTNNFFGPTLPTEFGGLTKMTYLGLGHNNYKGTIPTEYSQLTALQVFDVSGTAITGDIPSSFGSGFDSLALLDIADTMIAGAIPESLCRDQTVVQANCSDALQCC
ncbi:Leucine Rich Repeat [Seminavis robusta]|uniref:Leucine Rich Repeat n=1 Tax=Seminavis robusta TaxID=568900 RepID=A0A9N8EV92_9STRA|nr:Leucine Rich Repeat [Seminavis robusta]|eukprot:Sro1715_g293060.1 Leucine Rich Repeat (616) ;mRNA; f:5235-7082